jgi:hypothetical protein
MEFKMVNIEDLTILELVNTDGGSQLSRAFLVGLGDFVGFLFSSPYGSSFGDANVYK